MRRRNYFENWPGDWDEERENVTRRLIEGHLTQVVSIAQKHSASGVPMLDLIQEGNVGLMNAVRGFAEGAVGDFYRLRRHLHS
jgi:DNA-directed RNA polymerase sigma subunit (sigma70/sigma32)